MGSNMSHQARIDLFGLLCGLSGWGIGYLLGILRERERLKEAQRRADWAYSRYWNGNDGDEF
jgi:hypothetical protein